MKYKSNLDFVVQKSLEKIKENIGSLKDANIFCGFSGGADSTAILFILKNKQKIYKFNLTAIYFSHGNCPISVNGSESREFVKNFCGKHGIPLLIQELSLNNDNGNGWEAEGRSLRQQFFNNLNDHNKYVFLGHHLDDQNETTMMQLMRGGACRGAVAMKEMSDFYIRPFLKIHKKEIYQFLQSQNIKWIEDPTNINSEFTRNFWRNSALPLIEQHYPSYSQKLENFRKQLDELHQIALDMAVIDGLNDLIKGNEVFLNKTQLRLKNLIKQFLFFKGCSMTDKQIASVINVATSKGFGQLNLNTLNIRLTFEKKFNFFKVKVCGD